jgi:membrane protein YdbS with pleckstrin-like domain
MFCHHCGKLLSLESKFCNSCGVGVVANPPKPMTTARPSISIPLSKPQNRSILNSLQDNNEEIIFRIRPSFYSVGTAYAGAAIFSVLAIAILGYFGLPIGISLLLSLISFVFPLVRHIQRNRVIYTLTPSKIEIDFGIFSKTVRNIPLRNAQDVTISAAVIERIIGIGNVIIDSAAEAGKIQMRQIPNPRKHADLILRQVQQIHRLS